VKLSFCAVTAKEAEAQYKNSNGREAPNLFPTLPDPTGRFQFDIFSPLSMIKQIIGPDVYRSICWVLAALIFIFALVGIFYYLIPSMIANSINGSSSSTTAPAP
jgi:hypothetical protein